MSQATQAVEPSSSDAPPVFSRIHTLLERLQHIKEQKRRAAYGDADAAAVDAIAARGEVSTLETIDSAKQGTARKGSTTGAVAATATTGGAANARTKLVDFSGGVIRRRSHSMGDATKRRLIAAAVRAAVPDVVEPQPAERVTTSKGNGGWSTTGEGGGGGGGLFASRNSHRLLMSLPDGPHASLVRHRHSVAGPSASHAPRPSSDPSAAAGPVGRLRPLAELLASPSPAEPQTASAAAAVARAAAALGKEEEEEEEEEEEDSDEEDASSGEEEEEEVEGGDQVEEESSEDESVSASDAEGSDAASDASSSDCSDDDDCDRGPQEEEEEEEEDEEGEELTTQGARRSTEEEVVNARRSNDRRSRDEGIRDGDLEHAGEGMQVGDEDSERAGANTAWSKADKVKGRDKRRRRRKKASEPWVAATTATTSSRRKGRRKVGFVPSWVRTTAAATECWRDWDIDESACMSNQEAKALRALRGQENEFDDELTHLRYCSAYEVAQFFGGDADAISIFHTPPEASMDDPKTRPKAQTKTQKPEICSKTKQLISQMDRSEPAYQRLYSLAAERSSTRRRERDHQTAAATGAGDVVDAWGRADRALALVGRRGGSDDATAAEWVRLSGGGAADVSIREHGSARGSSRAERNGAPTLGRLKRVNSLGGGQMLTVRPWTGLMPNGSGSEEAEEEPRASGGGGGREDLLSHVRAEYNALHMHNSPAPHLHPHNHRSTAHMELWENDRSRETAAGYVSSRKLDSGGSGGSGGGGGGGSGGGGGGGVAGDYAVSRSLHASFRHFLANSGGAPMNVAAAEGSSTKSPSGRSPQTAINEPVIGAELLLTNLRVATTDEGVPRGGRVGGKATLPVRTALQRRDKPPMQPARASYPAATLHLVNKPQTATRAGLRFIQSREH